MSGLSFGRCIAFRLWARMWPELVVLDNFLRIWLDAPWRLVTDEPMRFVVFGFQAQASRVHQGVHDKCVRHVDQEMDGQA